MWSNHTLLSNEIHSSIIYTYLLYYKKRKTYLIFWKRQTIKPQFAVTSLDCTLVWRVENTLLFIRYTFEKVLNKCRNFVSELLTNRGPAKLSRYSDSLWAGRSGDGIPMGEIFRIPPERPWAPLSLLHNEHRVLTAGKAAGTWSWPPTPSNADIKERVELYIYSLSGPLWRVLGWLLPLPLFQTNRDLSACAHSFSILSDDRSKASSKTIPPHSAI
jgi:hypothetical protein